MEIIIIISSLISLAITIWVITLIYSISKNVKCINEEINKNADPLLQLFKARELGDKELCKKLLDEWVLNDFYNMAKQHVSIPYSHTSSWNNDKDALANRYAELYKICEVEPLDFERIKCLDSYKGFLTN